MKITKRNEDDRSRDIAPFSDHPFMSLRDAMNRLFDESIWDPFGTSSFLSEPASGLYPKVELSESDNEVRVVADLPGLNPDDIEVTVDEDYVTLSGTHESEEKEEGGDDRTYYRYERSYGSFRRDIPLPSKVDVDKVSAKSKNGVLTLTLPKAGESSGRKVKVESE